MDAAAGLHEKYPASAEPHKSNTTKVEKSRSDQFGFVLGELPTFSNTSRLSNFCGIALSDGNDYT